jgi:hypothetical protein
METTHTPWRVVLRYHVRYERDEGAVIRQLLTSTQSEQMEPSLVHNIPPDQSSKMHTVLDLHHMENRTLIWTRLHTKYSLCQEISWSARETGQ